MYRFQTHLRIALFFMILSALSLSAIPFLDLKNQSAGLYIVAGVFWGGLLIGTLIFSLAAVKFRKYKNWVYRKKLLPRQPLPGAFTFRRKPLHLALYAAIALGAVLAVTDLILHWLPDYVMFPILSITMAAFVLHCFLDGRNYQAFAKLKEGKKNNGQ